MLTKYCHDNHLAIVDYYIDDGFSGLSYERPSFMRMMEDIESGLIDLVITKDLSRLGRDYIMTGYLIDIYFKKMGVRYIAINDDIDTQRDSNDIAPFKNIMNDMYAKDISRKIKTAKRQRAYKGKYIAAQTPYGYQVDPEHHDRLIVDHAVADHVRLIFGKALEGKTLSVIADELAEAKVISPSVYKAQRGEKRFSSSLGKEGDNRFCWNSCTLAKILHDPVYLGHMVNHKYEVISYKTKEMRRVPKEEQIIVENMHEPIISQEVFDRVQQILGSRAHVHRHDFDNWLQDKVFCADCKHPMTLQIKMLKSGPKPLFRCIRNSQYPNECSGYRGYDYYKLLEVVWNKILEEIPNPEEHPAPNKSLVKQHVDQILIGKRNADGDQDLTILLNDMKRKRKKGDFPWLRYF